MVQFNNRVRINLLTTELCACYNLKMLMSTQSYFNVYLSFFPNFRFRNLTDFSGRYCSGTLPLESPQDDEEAIPVRFDFNG